jgi:catechol 2,3-dioxygenase-like lactoylglutathione lyase family enzyme
MSSWPTGIDAITLFVEDLEAAKRFYSEVFSLPVKFEDDSSVVIEFGNTLVNLLKTTAAPELIEPAVVASPEAGSRFQYSGEMERPPRGRSTRSVSGATTSRRRATTRSAGCSSAPRAGVSLCPARQVRIE